MKKTLHLLLVLLPVMAIGQTQTENYIKTTTYKEPTSTSITNPTALQASQSVTYFDGLGRPVQQVAHQQSPTGRDIVTPIEYDAFGRQEKEYLPYVPTAPASLDFKTTGLTEVGTFYNVTKYESTLNPYSQKEFEASPLNRVMKQAAPGNDWKLGNGHEIRFDYQTNTNADQVRRFGVSFIGGNTENPYLEDEGIYDPSQLYKTVTKDENWQASQTYPNDHTTEEFKDKEGRIVLKRTFDAGKWHDTYYVYDDYGNLTYVLPPKTLTYSDLNQVFQEQEVFLDTYENDVNFFVNDSPYSEMIVYISGGKLYCSFYAEVFTHEVIKTGKIADLYFTHTLPNMSLGNIMMPNINGELIVGGNAYIQDGGLYFSSTGANVYANEDGYCNFHLSVNLSDYQTNFTVPTLNRETFNNLIYQYKYDTRNRLVEKKLPGKDWEYIIYDKLDRPVLTQDVNLRSNNKWLFTKYDVFGRPVYTGMYTNTSHVTRINMQNQFDTQNNETVKMYESKVTSGTGYDSSYYTNTNFPNSNIELYTVNYYDNYSFDTTNLTLPATTEGVSIINYNNESSTQYLTKNLITGSKVRVLQTNNWITAIKGYDEKGRIIYSVDKNSYLATTDVVSNKLDFIGQIYKRISTHTKGTTVIIVEDIYTYDAAGRLKKITQELNNSDVIEVISENIYDELGQLVSKGVGGKTTQSRLQTVDYNYNIRGWLKNINDPNNLNVDLFGYGINYNTIARPSNAVYNQNKPLYNGNISSTSWKTQSSTVLKQYNYKFDALNRLTDANYGENNTFISKFNEYVNRYDRNGNILGLSRYMQDPANPNSGTMIDYLNYAYNDGNQLLKVDDNAKTTTYGSEGFKDGPNSDNDYLYDANGNMTVDKNKQKVEPMNITYNHLNLPISILFNDDYMIFYVYDALGTKLKKSVYMEGPPTETYYAGNFQYSKPKESNTIVLKFFNQPEGYVEINGGIFEYVYQYKDHLGNIRLSYKDISQTLTPTLQILEENSYYPFGLKHKNGNNIVNSTNPALKYKFNGKELQDELGLNMYDYGARNYDPALGRWMNVDPLAEKSRRFSPYTYALNNPVFFIDPDGMMALPPDDYFIHSNGQITVGKTEDTFDRFYVENKNGNMELVNSFDKNDSGLIELPSSFSFNSENAESSFAFSVKSGNEYRSYIRGDAMASIIGALSATNTTDLTINGFSLSDGKSPDPSVSHKNGINGDLRYLRTDYSGGAVVLGSENVDVARQNIFNASLYKFGWKDMISERFNGTLLDNTSSANDRGIGSDHTNHLHMQGYNPSLTYLGGVLQQVLITNKK
ncbi:DUF6443 domain-containing protein [Flavobacterium salmonis]|uniref:DUF6443 domain-containing protein n=1 Tax=Flavobacterium salmonis TaxID=2654844 RepID=A0A6V6ZCZ8_9FLAO|nr:DUF6443 domain-containing protein [Flavobacterium salmonis]CAD0009677.1 hypothetical protein FLAT13_05055 [Flavobacterium salmonis]